MAILLDTKGPEIRTGLLEGGKKVTLKEGSEFILYTEEMTGNAAGCCVTYPGLAKDVKAGDRILIDDGLIELKVKQIKSGNIVCHVENGGELGERKGVNVPNVKVKLPAVTEKDIDDILFGIQQDIDFIAASFIRSAKGVKEIRKILRKIMQNIFLSLPKLRMRKVWRILMKSSKLPMVSWWPGEIWRRDPGSGSTSHPEDDHKKM